MKTNPLRLGSLASRLVLLSVLTTACGDQAPPSSTNPSATQTNTTQSRPVHPTPPRRVREPAVAGLFYPKDPAELARTIDEFLAAAPAVNVGRIKAIVCPHAGYRYSGPVAAHAYKLLAGRSYDDVIVLAPSHYAWFQGASVLDADVFRTPLGDVPVSGKGRQLVKAKPFVLEPRCAVQRPAWVPQSSRPLPASGEDTPDTWEHADEVQVPFLQRVLKTFKLLTVVLGEVDPATVAQGLEKVLDDRTLLVVSSDLSHYHPYDQARALDTRCVQAVCDLDIAQMEQQEACGKTPILVLLHLAKKKGWKARKLDYRNSGDTTGDKSQGVVGYAAIAFYEPASDRPPARYSPAERKLLMDLAKRTVHSVVSSNVLPQIDPASIPERLREVKGCFVTLNEHGQLRGCIGHILPQEPLYLAVLHNARNAAVRDPRFRPVQPEELPALAFEISILTEPQPLEFQAPDDLLAKLHPHQDGVVLRIGGEHTATYLPQVWDKLPDKVQFLNQLAIKAGGQPGDWRRPDARVFVYHVAAITEAEP